MDPRYSIVTLRKEVRESHSVSPDEFAITLEQVLARTAPEDYSDPAQFFSRTCFTRVLKEHAGMVLRRLPGRTENTAPVLTLITHFGGGKTQSLNLYSVPNHIRAFRKRCFGWSATCHLKSGTGSELRYCPSCGLGKISVWGSSFR